MEVTQRYQYVLKAKLVNGVEFCDALYSPTALKPEEVTAQAQARIDAANERILNPPKVVELSPEERKALLEAEVEQFQAMLDDRLSVVAELDAQIAEKA